MNSQKISEVLGMIKEKRILLGITQNYFSEKLGMSQSAYNALETGKVDITVSKLFELIDVLKEETKLISQNSNETFEELDSFSKQLDFLR